MKEKCVEEGMKLARWLLALGTRGTSVAQASYEDYQRLSREAANALSDVDKMTCLADDEKAVIKNELTYLMEQAEKTHFLYTSDAGARVLNLLSDPQFYTKYYSGNDWVYAKVGTTVMRGKKIPTGVEIEQVSPGYDKGDVGKAVKIIEEKLKQ